MMLPRKQSGDTDEAEPDVRDPAPNPAALPHVEIGQQRAQGIAQVILQPRPPAVRPERAQQLRDLVGGDAGRLVVFTQNALAKMNENGLYL